MKRTIFSTCLAAIMAFSVNAGAQVPVVSKVTKVLPKLTLGIKAGANMQQLTGGTWEQKLNTGFIGGAFVGVTKKKIGVQGEILVKSAKFDFNSSIGSASVNAMYLDVPVLFEYKIVKRLWVQLGPQFSTMLSAKQSSTDVKNAFNTTDFSGVLGLQVNLPLHFTVGARYILGVTDVNNETVTGTKEAWNNRSIQLYLGYRIL